MHFTGMKVVAPFEYCNEDLCGKRPFFELDLIAEGRECTNLLSQPTLKWCCDHVCPEILTDFKPHDDRTLIRSKYEPLTICTLQQKRRWRKSLRIWVVRSLDQLELKVQTDRN